MEGLKSAHVAVIRRDSEGLQVLLVQRADRPVWELPGGAPELGDRNEVAVALRELREEVGLEVREYRTSQKIESAKFPGQYYYLVLVSLDGDCPQLRLDPREVADARWQSLAESASGLLPFQDREFFPRVLEMIESLVLAPAV